MARVVEVGYRRCGLMVREGDTFSAHYECVVQENGQLVPIGPGPVWSMPLECVELLAARAGIRLETELERLAFASSIPSQLLVSTITRKE